MYIYITNTLQKQQKNNHFSPISKTVHLIRRRHAGSCRASKDGLISFVLLFTPAYRHAMNDPLISY